MSKARPEAAAVFDVGKSNVRLSAVNDDGVALATIERPNRVNGGDPYPHFDADELYAWLIDGLATLARDFEIHSVVPVTHGASAALVDDDGLVLPIMDYEFRGVSEIDSEYDAMARDFARTASPKLPAGLNLGRQLFWQQQKFPREFDRATILPYPQYWAARLCGVRAWEPTSLGCHTDLWEPRRGEFSSFARTMGWDSRFGRRANAWTPLGPPLPEVAAATGLSRECKILAGIHDSNASYLAHRASREHPFCVVSTGTWIVVMAHGSPLDVLREELDTLANVDAFGNAVATARFMGGREYAAICGADAAPCATVSWRPGDDSRIGGAGGSFVRRSGRAVSRAGRSYRGQRFRRAAASRCARGVVLCADDGLVRYDAQGARRHNS